MLPSFSIFVSKQLTLGVRYCYTEGATEFFIVNSVTYQLMQVRSGGVDSEDDFQRIELRVNFSVPHLEEKIEPQASLLDVFYKVSIWHESSGAKITYRGPYSVCDDFLLSSSCNVCRILSTRTFMPLVYVRKIQRCVFSVCVSLLPPCFYVSGYSMFLCMCVSVCIDSVCLPVCLSERLCLPVCVFER